MSTSPKAPKMLNDDDDVTGTDSCEQYHLYIKTTCTMHTFRTMLFRFLMLPPLYANSVQLN